MAEENGLFGTQTGLPQVLHLASNFPLSSYLFTSALTDSASPLSPLSTFSLAFFLPNNSFAFSPFGTVLILYGDLKSGHIHKEIKFDTPSVMFKVWFGEI